MKAFTSTNEVVIGNIEQVVAEPLYGRYSDSVLKGMFQDAGFSQVGLSIDGDSIPPYYGFNLQLRLPFLEESLKLSVVECILSQDETNITLKLSTKGNELTKYQSRWLLAYMMQILLNDEYIDFNFYLQNMLQNNVISEEELNWMN